MATLQIIRENNAQSSVQATVFLDGATIGNVNNGETKAFDIPNGWHIMYMVLGKRRSVSIVFQARPDQVVEMEYSPVTGLSYPKQSEKEVIENSQKVLALLESEKSSLELALQQPAKGMGVGCIIAGILGVFFAAGFFSIAFSTLTTKSPCIFHWRAGHEYSACER